MNLKSLAAILFATLLATPAAWPRAAAPTEGAAPRDATGQPVAWSQLNHRRQLVFFGFTNCPEACPTTLMNASRALAESGSAERDTRILFISVDPERDTPQAVGAYVRNFGPAVTGMTGDAAGIAAAAAAFHVFYEKMPPMPDGGYMVNHSAALFLLGTSDDMLEIIPYGATAAEIAAALARNR